MSTTQFIRTRDVDGLREVVIDRIDKFNALSAAMMQAIADAIASAPAAGAKLVVIRALGERAFCAGADLAEAKAGGAALEAQEHALGELAGNIEDSAVPVLTVVHGRVMGAGVVIAALSDIVLARADTQMGFPEIQFGLYPAMVHAVLVPRFPSNIVYQVCVSARTLSAVDAQQVGLATEVFADGSFANDCDQRIAHYLARTEALQLGRELRNAHVTTKVRERLAAVSARAAEHFRSEAVQKLLSGFKRAH